MINPFLVNPFASPGGPKALIISDVISELPKRKSYKEQCDECGQTTSEPIECDECGKSFCSEHAEDGICYRCLGRKSEELIRQNNINREIGIKMQGSAIERDDNELLADVKREDKPEAIRDTGSIPQFRTAPGVRNS